MFSHYIHSSKRIVSKDIGKYHAAELYKNFIQDIFRTIKKVHADIHIYYSPPHARKGIRVLLGSAYPLHAQHGKDLGFRMKNAFQKTFRKIQKI